MPNVFKLTNNAKAPAHVVDAEVQAAVLTATRRPALPERVDVLTLDLGMLDLLLQRHPPFVPRPTPSLRDLVRDGRARLADERHPVRRVFVDTRLDVFTRLRTVLERP